MQDHLNTIIELKNVSFAYSKELVLENITLSIHKGDYIGIVGPNGGGKSTLLKLMLGVLKPQKGTIKLFDTEIAGFRDWYKIGYVPQKTHVETNFPATVKEVVAMGRFAKKGLFRFLNSGDNKKITEALKEVGMEEYKNTQINDLSGGQQQRVLIARALVSEPEIIFLDEPTAGVDVKTQKQFYALLRKLNRELNLTLILVSHEIDVLAHECSELGYINRSLVYYGTPHEFMQGKYFHELIGKGGLHYTDV